MEAVNGIEEEERADPLVEVVTGAAESVAAPLPSDSITRGVSTCMPKKQR
jgi:hypothetical protein